MSKALSTSGLQLPIIRKVIRKGDVYMCSLCRSEYKSSVEANDCLNHCWFDIKDFYPVVVRKSADLQIYFRCHFCCRDYDEESFALSCARRCLQERMGLHMREQLLNDLPLQPPPKRPSRIRVLSSGPRLGHHPPKPPPSTTIEQVSADEVISVESAPVSEEAPIVDRGRHIGSFPKQWVRQNEKYQCRFCNELFYTRMEVEACFKGHFDEEGYEKKT